jgi:hypothetical protein
LRWGRAFPGSGKLCRLIAQLQTAPERARSHAPLRSRAPARYVATVFSSSLESSRSRP